MAEMVYLQLAESVLAEKRKVLIRDVSKVVSDNLDLKNKIEKIELQDIPEPEIKGTAGHIHIGYHRGDQKKLRWGAVYPESWTA